MENHPLVVLIQKTEANYKTEIAKHWTTVAKKRAQKLYRLVAQAQNSAQLQKELLFKKLFLKTYSEKNDYLWRNELRNLKEELERFYVALEHQTHLKNNPAYSDWLLVQAYDRIKFYDGIAEKEQTLQQEKDNTAAYQYALDANLIKVINLQNVHGNFKQVMEVYPKEIAECIDGLNHLVAFYQSRINLFIAQFNFIFGHHDTRVNMALLPDVYSCELPQNSITQFYKYYTASHVDNYAEKIDNLRQAMVSISPIAAYNKFYDYNKTLVAISLGRELSSNGHFAAAHEELMVIKKTVDEKYPQFKSAFYVNYTTNLVKRKKYAEALYILDNEFGESHPLFNNMMLQSRLICYLNMRDTENLAKYISSDLDDAPFPMNYMLKLIKSAYFYLTKDYDVALTIVSNLLHTKDASDRMEHYQPIGHIFKKFYATQQKNQLQKKWGKADVAVLNAMVNEFEKTTHPEVKLVSIYQWVKDEIEEISKLKSQ